MTYANNEDIFPENPENPDRDAVPEGIREGGGDAAKIGG